MVSKNWAPLRKLFASPGVPSWLRAWTGVPNLHAYISDCYLKTPTLLKALLGKPQVGYVISSSMTFTEIDNELVNQLRS